MALQPFTWVGNQKVSTPEAAARQRAVAEALIGQASTPASNWAEGLGDVAAAFTGTQLQGRADEAEAAGRESAAAALAGLGPGAGFADISAALANPWLSGPQSTVAAALLEQNLQRQDPMYQMEMERAQLELDALRNPQPSLYDPNAPTSYQEYQLGQVDPNYGATLGDSPLVTVNTGSNNDFFTGLSNTEGEIFSGLLTAGSQASRNLAQVNQLEGLLANSKQGFEGAAVQAAGELGIDLGGASGVQAAQALINQMVPAQRQPGSGPMSDADLALFKQSIPRIINQQGGNELIIQTIKDINNYDMQLAQIVQEGMALAERTEDPGERARIRQAMRVAIDGLQNPVAPLKDRLNSFAQPAAPSATSGVTIRRLD